MSPISTDPSTSEGIAAPKEAPILKRKPFFSLDNRYIAPAFITCILLVGHLSFGILESYPRTILAIVTSVALELVLEESTFISGCIQRAHTFQGSAWEFWFDRRRSGRMRCARRSRSCQSTFCG